MKKRIILPKENDETIDLGLVNLTDGYIEVLNNDKHIGLILFDANDELYAFYRTGCINDYCYESDLLKNTIEGVYSEYKNVTLNFINTL